MKLFKRKTIRLRRIGVAGISTYFVSIAKMRSIGKYHVAVRWSGDKFFKIYDGVKRPWCFSIDILSTIMAVTYPIFLLWCAIAVSFALIGGIFCLIGRAFFCLAHLLMGKVDEARKEFPRFFTTKQNRK